MAESGILYVVATPIGNLGDISPRAIQTLAAVPLVAAEDTRHTGRLLSHHGVRAEMVSLHEHNEEARLVSLITHLQQGLDLALVSDAGTPLVNDPGYRLVCAAHEAGLPVRTVPGPSSIIAALSISGQPTDRFCFEGFPPAKPTARRKWLEALRQETRTLVLLESSHRVLACVRDLAATFGGERSATVARELSKSFETVRRAPLADLAAWLEGDPMQCKGEFVIVVAGAVAAGANDAVRLEQDNLLQVLLAELPASRAAAVAARLSGQPRRQLYARALALSGGDQ